MIPPAELIPEALPVDRLASEALAEGWTMTTGRRPVEEAPVLAGMLEAVGDGSKLVAERLSLATVALGEDEAAVGWTSLEDATTAPVDNTPVGETDSETETIPPEDGTNSAVGARLVASSLDATEEAVGLTDSDTAPPVEPTEAVATALSLSLSLVAVEDTVGLTDSDTTPPVEAT